MAPKTPQGRLAALKVVAGIAPPRPSPTTSGPPPTATHAGQVTSLPRPGARVLSNAARPVAQVNKGARRPG
jgi:hypothetical protein